MSLLQDFRYAIRQFRRAPGFTLVAVLTLALGIGATTAIFSLSDQILLRNLPVREPKRLVMLEMHGSDTGHFSSHGGPDSQYFSYPMYRDLRDQNSAFSGVAAMLPAQVALQWRGEPVVASSELVSGNYFDVLGVKPAMGRLLTASDEGAKNASPIAVLSYSYWKSHFASDPAIINSVVSINAHPFTIVGVAAPGFRSAISGTAPDVFVPMNMKPVITPGWDDLEDHRSKWLNITARLKDGVSKEQAEASLNPLWKALRAEELKAIPRRNGEFTRRFVEQSNITLAEGAKGFAQTRDQLRTPLLILGGMVALLALMASANVAGLLLVRAAGRIREMSVRYALGASRERVARQLMVEGLMLGLAGGLCGILLVPLISTTLLRVLYSGSGTMPLEAGADARVLAFDVFLSVAMALIFSLTPVLQFWRPNVTSALKEQTTTVGSSHVTFRRAIVSVQIGLSIVLLIGAGMFIRTLHNLHNADVGFAKDHLLTFQIDPRLAGYSPEQIGPLYARMLDTLAAQPGVKAVGMTDDPDLANNNSTYNIEVPGVDNSDSRLPHAEWERVDAGYLASLEQPLVSGRFIDKSDQLGSPLVAVINESFAKTFFGSTQNALGRTFHPGRITAPLTVVGVVKDAKHRGVRNDIDPAFYTPIFQEKEPASVEVYLRTYQDPNAAASTVRVAMRNLDARLVVDQLRSMEAQVDEVLSNERLLAILATGFGVLAVLMASIGLYGVLAFSIAQRTREIGVRMALGATRGAVVGMVLREVLWLAAVSFAVAVPLALMLSGFLRSQLYGISPRDPLTVLGVSVVVALFAGAAALIPAKRASSIEPMKALRYE